MHLKNAVAIALLLVVVIAGLASAANPPQFFTEGIHVETFEDGSGRAIDAQGNMLFFCLQGYACDHSIEEHQVFLPIID